MSKELREKELRAMATCAACNQKIGRSGLVFYRVHVTQYVVDSEAVMRQTGLGEMFWGRGDVAAAIGPDEVMARAANDVAVSICANCAEEPVILPALDDLEGKGAE